MSATIECPKKLVGRVIGKGGETINAMQKHSGAHIQIDQNVPEGQPCKVHITGNPQSVAFAQYLLKQVMDGGTGRDQNANLVEAAADQYVAMMKMQQQVAGAWQQPFQAAAQGFQGQQFVQPGMPQMYMQPQFMQGAYPQQFMGQQFPAQFMPAQFAAQMQQQPQQQQPQQQQQQQPQQQPQQAVQAQGQWTEYHTPEGTPYWYNSATGQSTWTKPAEA